MSLAEKLRTPESLPPSPIREERRIEPREDIQHYLNETIPMLQNVTKEFIKQETDLMVIRQTVSSLCKNIIRIDRIYRQIEEEFKQIKALKSTMSSLMKEAEVRELELTDKVEKLPAFRCTKITITHTHTDTEETSIKRMVSRMSDAEKAALIASLMSDVPLTHFNGDSTNGQEQSNS